MAKNLKCYVSGKDHGSKSACIGGIITVMRKLC